MKIIYVLEYYYPHVGGVETAFQKIAEGQAKAGNQVSVLTARLESARSEEFYNGVKILRLDVPKWGRRYWFTAAAFFRLLKIVSAYDLIHTSTYNAALPAWLAGKIFRKKVVLTVHEVWGRLWFNIRGMNLFLKLLHKLFEDFIFTLRFDYYIAVSRHTEMMLKKRISDSDFRVSTIYHGVDYSLFKDNGFNKKEFRCLNGWEGKFIILYYGRPGWAKGVEFLVESFSLVNARIPQAVLLLILSSDPFSKYKLISNLVASSNYAANIKILPSVSRDKLIKYILSSDCVVVPSISEGFGFSVAESNVLNIPVVASQAGSIPEIVSNRYRLFPSGNIAKLADAVGQVYKGNVFSKPLKRFYWSDSVKKHAAVYLSLLAHN